MVTFYFYFWKPYICICLIDYFPVGCLSVTFMPWLMQLYFVFSGCHVAAMLLKTHLLRGYCRRPTLVVASIYIFKSLGPSVFVHDQKFSVG